MLRLQKVFGGVWSSVSSRFMATHVIAEAMPMLNYKWTLDELKDEAVIRTDGLQFTDYDRKTKVPRIDSVLSLTEATLTCVMYTPHGASGRTYRDFPEVMDGRTPFVVASRVQFYPAFFDSNISKAPITGRIRDGQVGNSSITFLSNMFSGSGLQLWSSAIKVISVDQKIRKAVPYPDWWRNKYGRNVKEHELVDFELLPLKAGCMKNTIRVMGSDLDFHGHTNWTNYTKYAEDTIYFFARRSVFKHKIDIKTTQIKRLELRHGTETFEGDDLDVYVWRDDDNTNVIIAQIYKDKTFVFQGRYVYAMA